MKPTKSFVYFCNGIDSVFDSQVLELIISLNDKQIFRNIYLLLGIQNKLQIKAVFKKKIPSEIKIIFYKTYPNYPFFNFLLRKEISNKIKKLICEDLVIHTREEIIAWHLKKILKNNNILPDIRGANAEEVKENRNLSLLQKYLKLYNYNKALKNLTEFKKITAVSESLKKYLIRMYNLKPEKIVVTHDLAGKNFYFNLKQRIKIRKSLNINSEDTLFIFSSGLLQDWQNIESIKILADKGWKVLNLSKIKIKHNNVINKFVEYKNVASYLNAADIAIVWSTKRIVTEVRSPVKFGEYICCGLPIVANDSVDLITDYIKNTSYGLLLENLSELNRENVKRLLSLKRQNISLNAINWIGVENISKSYLNIYNTL